MSILRKTINKVTDTVDSIENKASEIKDNIMDLIPEIDFEFIEKELEFIGYSITKLEIAITVPPRMSMEIDLEKSNINIDKQNNIKEEINVLEENKKDNISKKVLYKIIQGLESAIKFKEKLKFKNKELSRVKVEGSMIPTVTLIYLNKNEKKYIIT